MGLAVGDALGTPIEGMPPGSFEPLTDMVGGGSHGLEPGYWTDDTSMALCLAESLVERRGFDPVDQLERYVRWWREGYMSSAGRCFDIGTTTRAALERFERERCSYCGSTDPAAAGNGSLMRLAPVPLFFARDFAEAVERSGESSRTTHGAAAAVDACRYFGGLIAAAVRGALKDDLLSLEVGSLCAEVEEVVRGSFRRRQPPEVRGMGHVVRTLEAALWAFDRSESFREGALSAVNLGEDADTTGAVFGQLAGAFYGESAIPAEWREKLALRETIERFADRLHELACER